MWAEDDHIKSLDISHAEIPSCLACKSLIQALIYKLKKGPKVKRSMIFCCPAWDKNDKNVT